MASTIVRVYHGSPEAAATQFAADAEAMARQGYVVMAQHYVAGGRGIGAAICLALGAVLALFGLMFITYPAGAAVIPGLALLVGGLAWKAPGTLSVTFQHGFISNEQDRGSVVVPPAPIGAMAIRHSETRDKHNAQEGAMGVAGRAGSMTEFCPQCGTKRVGAFRYCRNCQFDFDSVAWEPPQGRQGSAPSPSIPSDSPQPASPPPVKSASSPGSSWSTAPIGLPAPPKAGQPRRLAIWWRTRSHRMQWAIPIGIVLVGLAVTGGAAWMVEQPPRTTPATGVAQGPSRSAGNATATGAPEGLTLAAFAARVIPVQDQLDADMSKIN